MHPRRSDAKAALALTTGVGVGLLAGLSCVTSSDHPAVAPRLVLPPPFASAPTAPGPAPRLRTFDPVAVNAGCEGCHSEIAREWRSSLHREAYTHPVYQAQLQKEPAAFCNPCHAPETPLPSAAMEAPPGDTSLSGVDMDTPLSDDAPRAPPPHVEPAPTDLLGVGCVTCHVLGDQIWASPTPLPAGQDNPSPPGAPAHPVYRTANLTSSVACAACHEFPFPDARPRSSPLLMQSTITEHAASAFADQSCASCHMPDAPGGPRGRHKDHTFSASRNEALVRSAVLIEERPIEDNTLTLVLRPGRVGHAFPTGDMLRRIALTIDVLGPGGTLLQQKTQYLARHFRLSSTPGSPLHRSVVRDDRPSAQTAPLTLRHKLVRPPPGGRVHYVLRYERVADPTGTPDSPPVVDGAIVLAERTFPW